ncbi:MAG: Acetylglutamate kinase [Elusimicrobia bacterium]|nr:Acetylglutamate kinase [Elusimicrobiota bacterium]
MKRPLVIKAGGELMIPGPIRKKIILALARIGKKYPVVFVHGGGPQIEEELNRNKIPTRFVKGRRFTSPEAIVHVERVLSGQINKSIAADLAALGRPAVGLSCRDGQTLTAQPIPGLGRAGKPLQTRPALLSVLLKAGFLPVVSSVGSDKKGHPININADDVASALAISLKAANLIFLTNISGVLDKEKNRIPVLKTEKIDKLISSGVITGGMIPKVQSARSAIHQGIGEVDILNGKMGIDFEHGTRIRQ